MLSDSRPINTSAAASNNRPVIAAISDAGVMTFWTNILKRLTIAMLATVCMTRSVK